MGFIMCKGLKGPSGSHQVSAMAENLASSVWFKEEWGIGIGIGIGIGGLFMFSSGLGRSEWGLD